MEKIVATLSATRPPSDRTIVANSRDKYAFDATPPQEVIDQLKRIDDAFAEGQERMGTLRVG